jgi:rhamnopyranosyl-N-acetylglucosaminyl-diphospho-decaprenol beta-1,3/1,4-galactofuranosyltransferase
MGADGSQILLDQRLVAVVVTFNRFEALKKTLARLLDEPCEAIVVVDNGSADGTREWLHAQTDPRVFPVFTKTNLGGAGGFEHGMHVAMEKFDPDWVVVMDDDARPAPGAFVRFVDAAHHGWDVLAAAVYHPEGHICEMNRPSRNPFWHGAEFFKTIWGTLTGQGRKGFHVSDVAYNGDTVLPVDAGSFVGMFISRAVIQGIGLPDGKLFIYGDDVAYSLRARTAGYKIGFAPKLRFEHECSIFAEKKVYTPYWKIYYNYRNGLITYRQAAGWWFYFVVPVFILKWVLTARHYGKDKRIFYSLLWRALKDGFANRRTIDHTEVLALVETLQKRETTAL